MATLFIKLTANEDGQPQPIAWQAGYEFCLESEYWNADFCLCEYTIPDDDTPGWLEQELNTNPDVISYWIS